MATSAVTLKLLADTRGIRDGINQTNQQLTGLQGGLSKTTSFVKGMVGGFLALQGVQVATRFLGDAIGAASDLAETVNKSNTIFGANAASVNAWAKNAATSVGLSKAAALEAASGFGNMFTQLGFSGQAAADMSTQTVQMAADLGSFNNLPTADVADKISAAFRGEYDSLQSLIPNINAARVEQEAMAMTGKTNASALTAQEKAAAVLAIVNKDGAAAMGDFAKTSDGLANKQKILAAKFEDVKSVVGNALLPIMSGLASFVLDRVIPAAQQMATWFGDKVVPKLKELWTVIQTNVLPVLQRIGEYVMNTVVPAIKDMAKFIQDNAFWFGMLASGIGGALAVLYAYKAAVTVISAVTKVWAAVQAALNFVMNMNPLLRIAMLIGLLVGALIYAWQNSETFRNIVIGVWEAVKGAVMSVLNWFTGTLWPGIQAVWNGIVEGVKFVFNMYVAYWTAIINFVKAVPGAIMGFFSAIGNFFSNIWNGIKNGAVNGWNAVVGFVRGVPGMVMGAIGNLGSTLVNAGGDLLRGLWNGIQAVGGWLKDKIIGFFGRLVPGWVKDIFGIHSPSKMFAEFGKYLTQGLAVGITDSSAMRQVRKATDSLSTSVTGAFGTPQLAMAGSGAGGTTIINQNFHVAPTADQVSLGREIEKARQAWLRTNGR